MGKTERSVARAWLEQLKASGVDYFFANAGTDFPSIVEAFATEPEALPRPVICAHENTAVGMAHGYSLVSGRAQVAMVHVNVGTANAINGLINAERDHVPMILAAGMTPIYEEGVLGARNLNIHWAQDMFDQAGMVRETVRASFEMRDPRLAASTTERALALAHSRPAGPVYLMLPREILAMSAPDQPQPRPIRPSPAAAPTAAEADALCALIAQARRPLIITARAGADHDVPALLGAFATRIAAPVVEFRPRHLNLDQCHPLHGGFEVSPWIKDADLVIVLECDVPWIPAQASPAGTAQIVQIGEDPIHIRYPLRSFGSDLTIKSGAAAFLRQMLDILPPQKDDATARLACQALRDKAPSLPQASEGLTHRYVSYCIDQARAEGSVLVNEYPLVREVMATRQAGEFYGSSPAGGLGWGAPAALGVKLADPSREVIACLGDGSYIFCNPIATLQVAAAEKIAILIVVYNNGGWKAVDRATRAMHPQGQAAQANVMPLTRFDPVPDYAPIAAACGVWAEKVTEAADLPAALERALAQVRAGRTAVVDVLTTT